MIKKSYSSEKGSSLIEVMIALFILAVGMLGVLAMQTTAVRSSQQAASESQANVLLLDAYEFIVAAKATGIPLSHYRMSFGDNGIVSAGPPGCISSGPCGPQDIASWNMYTWRVAIESLLPGGQAAITTAASGGDDLFVQVRFAKRLSDDAQDLDYVTKKLTIREL